MPEYTLIDPVTGEQRTLSELELTRNIRLNCILLRDQKHLGIITHRDLVSFSRWCASREALARSGRKPDQRTVHALVLVDRWLEDELNITSEELKAAAGAAAEAAAEAAWAAAGAAWAAAEAARAAADRAAAGAAGFAWAARAAAWAASYEAQAQWWVEHLQSGK